MTEARLEFAYLDDLDILALHTERQAILDRAPSGDFQQLDDDSLTKLWAVMRALRRKAVTPAGRKKVRTIEELA